MGNWTPGPWRIERSAGGWVRAVCDSDGRCVCYGSIEDADAALIAAAPELADALRELLRILDAAGLLTLSRGVYLGPTVWYVKASDACDYARAALAKAGAA